MKKLTLILGLVVLMTACDFLNKEKKAIEICQNSKFQVQTNNIFGSLAANMYGLNADATWLDFANMLAQKEPNKKHDWSAKETDVDGVYMVSFTDERGWGHRWEVIIDEQIVKHINANEYLSRKYGFSRIGDSGEFTISSIKTDTLKIYKKYKNSTPEIIYEFRGTLINNTDKSIIDADIEGKLKLIFEEKTVEEKSSYYDGFLKKVSKSNPWKPGEEKEFKLKTDGIEIVYADYVPPYVIFEIALKAEDPVGYSFDENIKEIELVDNWKKDIHSKK